jgi:ankyrin repeat protein
MAVEDVNALDAGGWSALHEAARDGKVREVNSLLAAGADIDLAHREYGFTALHFAVCWSQTHIVKILIAAGADVNSLNPGDPGGSPLYAATRRASHVATIQAKILLAAGANPNIDIEENAYSAALFRGNRRVLGLLLQFGAAVTPGPVSREAWNKASFAYHDAVVAAGGYEPFVKKHRILLSSVVDKVVEAKFGRRAPQEVCAHVVTFWTPPGGF